MHRAVGAGRLRFGRFDIICARQAGDESSSWRPWASPRPHEPGAAVAGLTRLASLAGELAEAAVEAGHVGFVAGVASGREITAAGAGRTHAGGRRPDGGTLFRICSLSKTVTGTALARAVLRGELDLADSLRQALPAWFDLPADPFDSILLEHLATHSSGLPRGLPVDPHCGIAEFAGALARAKVATQPGSGYAYSNLGAQLAGLVLTQGAEVGFDSVVRSTLGADPGLGDIVERPDPGQRLRVAPGHDESGRRCATPTYPLGVASGGLHGSADALLRWVRALWDDPGTELASALQLATTPRAPAGEGNRVGLFWHIGAVPGGDGPRAVWHNGSLPGYRSFLALVPERRIGVVVLSNTARPLDALGARLLRAVA